MEAVREPDPPTGWKRLTMTQDQQSGAYREEEPMAPARGRIINNALSPPMTEPRPASIIFFSLISLMALVRLLAAPRQLIGLAWSSLDDVAAVGEEVECRCPDHGCGFFATWSHVAGLLCAWIQLGVHFPDGYLPGQLRRLGVRSLLVYHRVIPPFRPGPAAAASHGAGTGRQLRRCYSFGESFTSPGGDAMPDDSRQQASISRTVLDRA